MLVLPSYVSSSSSMRPHTGVLQIPESGSVYNPICAVCIKRMRCGLGCVCMLSATAEVNPVCKHGDLFPKCSALPICIYSDRVK